MTGERWRLAAGLVLALLLAGGAAAAEANNTTAAPNTTPVAWEQTYGSLANETLLSLLLNGTQGYDLVGRSAGNGTGTEIYLVRAGADGTPVREERVPFGAGNPAAAVRTADGGVMVAGDTGGPGGDVVLLRLAADGRRLWSRSYAVGSGRETGDAVVAATDGGYVVAGTTDLADGRSPALLLLRVGEDGGEVWQRTLAPGGSVLMVGDLVAAPDGGYLVVGSSDADRAGVPGILLVKVSSGGNREWQRTYSFGAEPAGGTALVPSPDGGWLLLGDGSGTGSAPRAAVLVRVDTAGNEQWRRRLAAGSWGSGLARAGTGGYAVAGAVASPEGTRSWVARLDGSGTEVWNRTFAIGNGPSRAIAVTDAGAERLVVAGDASRTPDAVYDLYLSVATPPAVAPNVTATANITVTANLTATATPPATLPANATPTATGTVPAPTTAPLAPLTGIAAVAAVGLLAFRRWR